MKRFGISLILIFLLTVSAMAQLATGQWRMHLSYNTVYQIAQTPDKVYAVSEGSLFSVDKFDKTIEFYSKLSELNGTSISLIGYDKQTKTLLIIYRNGMIDLLRSGGVENISDLYQKQMSESKTINAITFYDSRAYLATDFGVMVLNIRKNEIQSTYFIGDGGAAIKVTDIAIVDDVIYASTGEQIYYADMKTANLMDYAHWKKLLLPTTGSLGSLVAYNNRLLALADGRLYEYKGGIWRILFSSKTLTDISVSDENLFGYTGAKVCVISNDMTYFELPVFEGAQDVIYDSQNRVYWFAAGEQGLAEYAQDTQSTAVYQPDGPISNFSYRLKFVNGKLYSVPGGRWADRYQRRAQVMVYDNGEWKHTEYWLLRQLTGLSDVYDFMNVAVDPKDPTHFFATSYGCGLFEYKDMVPVKHYNVNNASFRAAAPQNPDFYTRLDGAIFDSENNLWVMATGPYGPNINILSPNGQWKGLNIYHNSQRVVFNTPQPIVIDNRKSNYKWIASGRDVPGLALLDDNGTPTDTTDDRSIFRTSLHDQRNSSVPLELIFACEQETNGDLWLGTLTGPVKIPASSDFFRSDACERVLVPRTDGSGLNDYLLNGERINAIAFDGAGRKWMGTQGNGVFLLSSDGTQTISHFTTDNSPLPSNTILSIAINEQTGEVFFGTDGGLVSYQSDASQGAETYANVYAYPNPVRENYNGVITIVGLKEDTQLRITDIGGSLVATAVSNGGTAVWDGRDQVGKRVPTGVYLIQGVDGDNKDHILTKVLIITQ